MLEKSSISLSVEDLNNVIVLSGKEEKSMGLLFTSKALVFDQLSYDTDTVSIDSHCHSSTTNKKQQNRRAERTLWIAVVLASVFIAFELAGGIIGGSLAVMTDACHMTSDLLSFFLSIIALRIARRPASKNLSFGYERAEMLGALISVIILWILTGMLVVMAVVHIRTSENHVDANVMLITSGCGVLFNIIMGLLMHFGASGGDGHGHGHGHSQGGQNMNLRAAFVHVLGDLMQSISVLGAALIIKFTGWMLADPLCTFLFAFIVLCTTSRVVRDIFCVLMEATPRHLDVNVVRDELCAIEGVIAAHDLHLWSLNTSTSALAVHLAIDEKHNTLDVLRNAERLVATKYRIQFSTIQVERYYDSMRKCNRCFTGSLSRL